jgi:LSD1 subclass zinc finger protein
MTVLQIQSFPCSSCGAKLEYNPGAARLKCPYCGSEEEIPVDDGVEEIPFTPEIPKPELSQLAQNAIEVACPGCRASITFIPPEIAGKCPFCGTGIVAEGQTAHPVVTPGGILPAQISAKDAKVAVQKWINSRWFAPTALKHLAQKEGVQGVYLPFWTCDSQTYSAYNGQRGDYYYRTRSVSRTNSEGQTEWVEEEVRETSWRSVSGQVNRFFDDVLVVGTRQIPEEKLVKLEPWDLEHLVPYSPAYMAGFKAQRSQVALNDAIVKAKMAMDRRIEVDVQDDIGGDEQRVGAIQTNYTDITYKHILMPVWISAYRYRNKQFQVMVNAQTGQVLGERPWSVEKIAAAVIVSLLVVGGGFWLFSQMKGSSSGYRRSYSTSIQQRSTPRTKVKKEKSKSVKRSSRSSISMPKP